MSIYKPVLTVAICLQFQTLLPNTKLFSIREQSFFSFVSSVRAILSPSRQSGDLPSGKYGKKFISNCLASFCVSLLTLIDYKLWASSAYVSLPTLSIMPLLIAAVTASRAYFHKPFFPFLSLT